MKNLLKAAGHTGHFADHELQDLGVQLQAVTNLDLKENNKKHDQRFGERLMEL